MADIKDKFKGYWDSFLNSKKYWIVYLILIVFTTSTTLTSNNLSHPKFEIIIFLMAAVLGVFCITYCYRHNCERDMYKIAFVVIVCFGLVTSLILPISEISDEREHFNRAELTSEGIIFPHWTGEDMGLTRSYNMTDSNHSDVYNKGAGFEIPRMIKFFQKNKGMTVFETANDTDKINYTTMIVDSVFEQNPFFGYLPQAFGILIAKLLDLNVIWLMWLGRIMNLIFYAGVISFAIKKTPYLKMPLLAVACLPISIYQSASVSIDAMVIGGGILAVAYFIYMSKSEVENKDIAIFALICLITGLCKLPYLALIFLILFVPKSNFKNINNACKMILISILSLSLIGLMWSNYSQPAMLHSWRSAYVLINPSAQTQFLIHNPGQLLLFLKQIFTTDLFKVFNHVFNFYGGSGTTHYVDNYAIITVMIYLFLIFAMILYPNGVKFDLKTKIGSLIVVLVIYVGTAFVQLLSLANVGQLNLGMCGRYFIPLLALVPIIIGINSKTDDEKTRNYSFTLIIVFLATLVLALATKYY